MQEFNNKMAEYEPVREEFTQLLKVREEDLDDILAAAQKEKEKIGKQATIFKEKKTSKSKKYVECSKLLDIILS